MAGALLIRKYWEPISAHFPLQVIEGIMSAFAPVGEMFLRHRTQFLTDSGEKPWRLAMV